MLKAVRGGTWSSIALMRASPLPCGMNESSRVSGRAIEFQLSWSTCVGVCRSSMRNSRTPMACMSSARLKTTAGDTCRDAREPRGERW